MSTASKLRWPFAAAAAAGFVTVVAIAVLDTSDPKDIKPAVAVLMAVGLLSFVVGFAGYIVCLLLGLLGKRDTR